jgi:hypothetical protein
MHGLVTIEVVDLVARRLPRVLQELEVLPMMMQLQELVQEQEHY